MCDLLTLNHNAIKNKLKTILWDLCVGRNSTHYVLNCEVIQGEKWTAIVYKQCLEIAELSESFKHLRGDYDDLFKSRDVKKLKGNDIWKGRKKRMAAVKLLVDGIYAHSVSPTSDCP